MRPLLAICNVALLLVSLPAQGAELFYMDHDPITDQYVGPIGPLVMSGEITPGDYGRLLSKIIDDEDRFLAQDKILLASDGGDVAEALRIAALVKSLFTAVIVAPLTGRCVSACFFIYAAAAQREADGERLIGKCAWSDSLEREVFARKRPLEDLTQMLKCRGRVTEDAARQALALASKEKLHIH